MEPNLMPGAFDKAAGRRTGLAKTRFSGKFMSKWLPSGN
jgi:hypothetical protein